MAATLCRPRPSTGARGVGKALISGVAALAALFVAAPCFAPIAGESLPSLSRVPSRACARGGVAMRAEGDGEEAAEKTTKYPLRKWKGTCRYKRYGGYVYHKKRIPGVRLRLDRWGTAHWPFYRIKAAFQKRRPNRSGRFLESLGWWDPMRETDDPKFFRLRADRCVYWLRNGAQPTDMVASLLDRIGIIRRTGPNSKFGEWEWRIPKNSGPEAPAGWAYDGPQMVTWGNKPYIRHRRTPNNKNWKKIPLIERYGFQGYEKIPVDDDAMTEPLVGDTLLESFGNTELPVY